MKINNKKTLVIYGLGLAAAAFALEWMEYQFAIKLLEPEVYTILIALVFTLVGVWIGKQFFSSKDTVEFEVNVNAIRALGLTERELEVLQLLSEGCSNKEVAEKLFVAPNTVKTHVLNLYKKLDVERRTQAIQKAKTLKIVP